MKERKYKEDYRLVTSLDHKGNPKQTPVYEGDYFMLGAGVSARDMAVACVVLGGVFFAAYVSYLFLNTPSAYCIYVLPVACAAAIPLIYLAIGAVNALRAPEKMTRVQAETGIGRVMKSHLGCGILSGLAAAGDVVFTLVSGRFSEEWPGLLLLTLSCAAAFAGFFAARGIYKGLRVLSGRRKGGN